MNGIMIRLYTSASCTFLVLRKVRTIAIKKNSTTAYVHTVRNKLIYTSMLYTPKNDPIGLLKIMTTVQTARMNSMGTSADFTNPL